MTREEIIDIVSKFDIDADLYDFRQYGSGHINSTFKLSCKSGAQERKYTLQNINTNVFKHPEWVMDNIVRVTTFLKEKIIAEGGDPERETLTVIPTKKGGNYYVDSYGRVWRMYNFVDDVTTYQLIEKEGLFETTAELFGEFQKKLLDFPAETLYETIPNFHNTPSRMADLERAVAKDSAGRAASVADEIKFAFDRKDKCGFITSRLESGVFPTRVTHNDTKINNVLIDNKTERGLCIIDLDTVMPGSALYDFGDAIRFGASSAVEDETDLDKVHIRLDLFEEFTRGYIKSVGDTLTKEEIEAFPMGAYILTLETGLRFLTDHLNGDVYFKIHRENHNLDRARNQFKLVADMEEKMAQMQDIVKKYL